MIHCIHQKTIGKVGLESEAQLPVHVSAPLGARTVHAWTRFRMGKIDYRGSLTRAGSILALASRKDSSYEIVFRNFQSHFEACLEHHPPGLFTHPDCSELLPILFLLYFYVVFFFA